MIIRLVDVIEVRESETQHGFRITSKLRSQPSDGRMVYVEINEPAPHCTHFEPLEEMVFVLMPAKSLLANIAKALNGDD